MDSSKISAPPRSEHSTDKPELEMRRLLTAHRTSQITGRSISALAKNRMKKVGIPYIKIGSSVRCHPDDVAAFFRENRHGG